MLKVVPYKFPYRDKDCRMTKHEYYDRWTREKYILDHYDLSNKNILNVFCVDKGHRDGIELHTIYKNGIIKIINPVKRCIITYLIARPQQIQRYYDKSHTILRDTKVIDIAMEHQAKGLNYM